MRGGARTQQAKVLRMGEPPGGEASGYGSLDRAGGMSPRAWGLAFLHVAVVGLLEQLAFIALRSRDLAGDRRRADD